MVRVHEQEFALIREYYQIYTNNYAVIVTEVRRRIINEPRRNIPENVVELWRGGLAEHQLRRRVRDAIKRRIGM